MYTAIMATTTDAPYIEQALLSIANQSTQPTEVIVVVNGPDAIDSPLGAWLRQSFPKFHIVKHRFSGQAHAYSLGLASLSTKYVAFLDSDDFWIPGKQEAQLALLEGSPDFDVACGATVNFREDSDGSLIESPPKIARLFGACTFGKAVFEAVGAPNPDAPHFTWLYRWWLKAENAGIRSLPVNDPVMYRRIHETNSWLTSNGEGRSQLIAELRRVSHDRRGMDA